MFHHILLCSLESICIQIRLLSDKREKPKLTTRTRKTDRYITTPPVLSTGPVPAAAINFKGTPINSSFCRFHQASNIQDMNYACEGNEKRPSTSRSEKL